MGTGSFALEAMEAAGRNNAKHITLVSRPRKRWVAGGLARAALAGQRAQRGPALSIPQRPTLLLNGTPTLPFQCRWVCPFSRQYTVTALCFAPFLPWALKVKFVHVSRMPQFGEPQVESEVE